MTIPGGMMQASVNRLRDAIQASKEASDEVKRNVAAQQVTPVDTGREVNRAGGSAGEATA